MPKYTFSPLKRLIRVGVPFLVCALSQTQFCLAQANQPSQTSKTSTPDSTIKEPKSFAIAAQLSRSRSLVDFKDGSRSDSMELLLLPSYKLQFGSLSARIGYAQDLNDSENTANGFADTVLGLSLKPKVWSQASGKTQLGLSFSSVIPTSDVSRKQTQLQTALSTSLSLGYQTDMTSVGQFGISGSVSAGRNFHTYQEDINGSVLTQYSSNQVLKLNYSVSDFSFDFEFWNRSRWSYQNNVRQSFIMSQELSYGVNPNFSLAIGHTNEGSVLKANGQDSNIELFNEDTSTIYGSVGISY